MTHSVWFWQTCFWSNVRIKQTTQNRQPRGTQRKRFRDELRWFPSSIFHSRDTGNRKRNVSVPHHLHIETLKQLFRTSAGALKVFLHSQKRVFLSFRVLSHIRLWIYTRGAPTLIRGKSLPSYGKDVRCLCYFFILLLKDCLLVRNDEVAVQT